MLCCLGFGCGFVEGSNALTAEFEGLAKSLICSWKRFGLYIGGCLALNLIKNYTTKESQHV